MMNCMQTARTKMETQLITVRRTRQIDSQIHRFRHARKKCSHLCCGHRFQHRLDRIEVFLHSVCVATNLGEELSQLICRGTLSKH